MFEKTYDINNLYDAWRKVRKVSHWKEKTQRYEEDLLFNLSSLSDGLKNGTAKLGDSREFTIMERGKKRLIHSYDLNTRVAVRSFIDNVLFPKIKPKLIYDNGASITGKGLDFYRGRLKAHLQKYYRKYGTEGYILITDFRKYFDNIDHEKLKKIFSEVLQDRESEEFVNSLIDTYKTDISCLSEEEKAYLRNHPFDSVSFYNYANKSKCNGYCFLKRGVFIGGQLSQIAGIVYPYKLDNFIKIVKGEKYYGRYMDDLYVIHNDKEHLKLLLKEIRLKCEECGIFLNEKKTQIIPINKPLTICKIQYFVKEGGDIVLKPCRVTFSRERKAIRKFEKDLKAGRCSIKKVYDSYMSWKGNISRFDCKQTIINMDKYFSKRLLT